MSSSDKDLRDAQLCPEHISPLLAGGKRPRADHEASPSSLKTRRLSQHYVPKIVPFIASGPDSARVPIQTDGDCPNPGIHTRIPSVDLHKTNAATEIKEAPAVKLREFHTDKSTPSDAETIDEDSMATRNTTTAKRSIIPVAHTSVESRPSHLQSVNEVHGPILLGLTYHEHYRLLRWSCTPFSLVPVADFKLCPRLIVSPNDKLCQILGAGEIPLGLAIAKIHEFGRMNQSVPCEARRILKMFEEIHLGFANPYITFLDPLLYKTSETRSHAQLECFRRKEWGWLHRAGRPLTIDSVLKGAWDFDTIQANYSTLEISLVLSLGTRRIIYTPDRAVSDPPTRPNVPRYHLDDPLERRGLIQLYNPSHKTWSPVPVLKLAIYEDIIFCFYWLPELNSEAICALMNNAYKPALEPHHIDNIARQLFRGYSLPRCQNMIFWVTNLKPLDRASREARILNTKYQADSLGSRTWL